MLKCCRPIALFVFLGVFAFINNSRGQSALSADTSSLQNALAYFQNAVGDKAHLYTGKEYTYPPKGIKGHQFFSSGRMLPGEIFYDGTLYTNIPLLFDIHQQVVVIENYGVEDKIFLLGEKIKYFSIEGHRFENVALTGTKDENTGSLYDVVFSGKASVLVKRLKRIKNPVKAEEPPEFVEEDVLYIRNDNTLYAVDDKAALLRALHDKNDLLKQYLRKNRFRFKKNIEKELVMTAAYYTTLNK
jgi:hypothetical protein